MKFLVRDDEFCLRSRIQFRTYFLILPKEVKTVQYNQQQARVVLFNFWMFLGRHSFLMLLEC